MGVKLPNNIRNILPAFAVSGDKPVNKASDKKVESLETTVQEQQKKIDSLEETLGEKDNQLDELTSEIEGYQQIENDTGATETITDEKEDKHILNIMKEMRADKAAEILLSMEKQEASTILSKLDQKIVAEILSEMEPDQAAEYLKLMKN